ncbi:hypothetical protein B9Y44_05775 [Staphylococcus aureus]|nr:hypothetical protein B9Y44_05775 [Staphylococcus aureus]
MTAGPNTGADGRPAYNNVQVGGAPTQKLAESQLTIMCKLGNGSQKRMILNSLLSQHLQL